MIWQMGETIEEEKKLELIHAIHVATMSEWMKKWRLLPNCWYANRDLGRALTLPV